MRGNALKLILKNAAYINSLLKEVKIEWDEKIGAQCGAEWGTPSAAALCRPLCVRWHFGTIQYFGLAIWIYDM